MSLLDRAARLVERTGTVDEVARDVDRIMGAVLRHDDQAALDVIGAVRDPRGTLSAFVGAFAAAFVPEPGEDDELIGTLRELWAMVRDATLSELAGQGT